MSTPTIIKYEGDNTTFIWKHPIEDFYTGTQLIVHESQEAIFFLNGQALDLFGPGRHTLETQSLPLLARPFNRPFGGKTPFHCEVYFINKTEQMAVKWGTDSKVEYVEPAYKFPLQIGASGEMSLRAEDSRKLLVKLVGTTAGITQQDLVQKFRGILMTRVKTYLANLIRENSINIFSIDEYLTVMSDALHQRLTPDFADYGLSLERFYITTIVKPEEDRMYQRFKEIHFRQYADVAEAQLRQQVGLIDQQAQAQRMVIEAQGIAQKRALEGYTYQDERSFDVAQRVASNEAIGQMSNLGIGLILAAVATILLIALPGSANLCAAYVFCLIGIGMMIAGVWATDENAPAGYALLGQVGWLLPVSLFISVVVLVLQGVSVFAPPVLWHCIAQLIPLAFAGIRVIAVYTGRQEIERVDKHVSAQKNRFTSMVNTAAALQQKVNSLPEERRPAAAKALKQVIEGLRYSDPMSTAAVEDLDSQIESGISLLKSCCSAENAAQFISECEALCTLIQERSNALKASKS